MPSTSSDRLNGLTTSVAVKAPCRAVSTVNLTLSGEQTVNGVALTEGDRVLAMHQTTGSENGIYVVSTGSWTRAADFDGNRDAAQGTIVPVVNGSGGSNLYEVTTSNPIVIGTTSLAFSLRYGANVRYDETAAETSAEITPVNDTYAELDLARYGTNVTPGTTDMTSALNDAISVASELTAGGRIVIDRAIAISAKVVVPNGITLDFNNNTVTPLSDIDMFEVRPGGQILNIRYNLESFSGGYTSTVLTLKGDGGADNGFQGTAYRPWLVGVHGRMDLDTLNGTHIYLDATSQYLQEHVAVRGVLRGGGKGIHLLGDDTDVDSLEYAQGNLFADFTMHGVNKFIHCEGEATAGNIFANMLLQQRRANPICTIHFESAGNKLTGFGWDQIAVTCEQDGTDMEGFLQSHQYAVSVTDTGRDTRSRSRGATYYDRTSINTCDDARHELFGPGKIEFRDFILGGKDPRWTQTLTGTATVAFGAATFGATTGINHRSPYMEFTCPTGANTAQWDFNGNGFVRATQNPKVHFTNYTNAGDGRIIWRIGLYNDANNYIVLEQDFGTHADDDIRLVTRAAGSSTTTKLVDSGAAGTVAADRVSFCSILITSTSVLARVKQYNNAGTGDTGRVADGALWDSSIFTATNTTNIPSALDLEPFVLVDHGAGASSALMQLLDYQLIAARKAQL